MKTEVRFNNTMWKTLSRALYRIAFGAVCALVVLILTEWIARGTLDQQIWVEYIQPHRDSYLLAWMFLLAVYMVVDSLTRCAPLAVFVTAFLGCVPGAVNFYTLQLRGEPFLPWDFSQFAEAAGVVSAAGLKLQPSMVWAVGLVLVLLLLAWWTHRGDKVVSLRQRFISICASAVLFAWVLTVYLTPALSQSFGIWPDAWMQDRYYRWYGVISAFMTNLQNLEIDKPDGYSKNTVDALLAQTGQAQTETPRYPGSYAASAGEAAEKTPTILYVMDESYWDVTELEAYGVSFDTDISQNLHSLKDSTAQGRIFSPSFGGGTCDVEFEALTGYSVAYLPSGAKPFQQHITDDTYALPWILKERGYQTAAIHGYYGKYWNRDDAYPRLGLDSFLSLEDMYGIKKVRAAEWGGGLASDESMGEQIIRKYEELRMFSDAPVFLHTVTMQNHTNYMAENYPDEERVRVTSAPAGMSEQTIGALEDFATGVRDADRLIGMLVDYFSQVDEPVILVFWGDHYNPIGSGYEVYTATGYAGGSSADPKLHQPTLMIWSNYDNSAVDLGTIATYELSPVVFALYGLEMPPYYEYLLQQMENGYRSRTAGVTVNVDGTVSQELSDAQMVWYKNHWLLQYDLMFGDAHVLEYAE